MRGLISRHEREKKRKRNQLTMGAILVAVMILSVAGYAFQSGPGTKAKGQSSRNSVVYNGIEFFQVNGFWTAGTFSFRYNPEEIENLFSSIENNLDDATFYQKVPLYVYSDNNNAGTEVKINMDLISSEVGDACPEGEGFECADGIPVKTCGGGERLVIIQESAEETGVRQEENCVFIEGKNEDLVALADGFLFKILRVI